jgi:repressor LexA
MNIGQRLKYIRESKGISRRELAKMMGKDEVSFEQYLYKLESGKILNPGIELVESISKALGISPKDLLEKQEEHGDIETVFAIPTVDVKAGAGNHLYAEEYIYVNDIIPSRYLSAIKIKGDSMEPIIKDGEYVIIDTSSKDIINGKIYVISDKDGGLLVRRIYKLNDGFFRLLPENEAYKSQDVKASDIRIIGKAIKAVSPSRKLT